MGEFDFDDRPVPQKRARSGFNPATIAAGLIGIALVAVGGMWFLNGQPARLALEAVKDQSVREEQALTLKLSARAEGLAAGQWIYGIIAGPPGARVDAKSGVLTWTPGEEHGPGEHTVTVAVQSKGNKPAQDKASFKITVSEVNQPPVITEIPPQTVAAGETLRVAIRATDADQPAQTLVYRLKSGPKGAAVDAASGMLSWPVPVSGVTGEQSAVLSVSDAESGGAEQSATFTIQVEPGPSPLQRLVAALQAAGLEVETTVGDGPPGFTGTRTLFAAGDELLTVFEYDSEQAARQDAAQVTDAGQKLFGQPAAWKSKTSLYRWESLIVIFGGSSARVATLLGGTLGQPFVVAEISKTTPTPDKPVEPTIAETLLNSLVALHEKQNLTGKKDFPGVRKLFAGFVEQQNEQLLAQLGEGDGAPFKKWLDEHPDFKEEFLIAVAPEDDLAAAWKILQTLHQKFPTRLNDYGQLAIATALTWDNEGNVDHYTDHQQRTHSRMPGDMLGAVENFEYFVQTAGIMQGRAQFLPWPFLMYLVNHKTPRGERDWAATSYVPRRTMFGKCYADVPYDHEMLRTESQTCKLEGKDYSLPNIRQFGGVCAMQADFAARVGKSIGVPAEYVAGEAAGGELHAWVMWVEIKQVSRTGISFTLESHGRYRGDKFYVGTLRDPQTGRGITDRELELRLQAVGLNPAAYHHADLIMRAYPQLRDRLQLKPAGEIALLNEVIELCPGNESAWKQVALLAREGRIGSDSNRQMTAMFDKLFRTFAGFPDFTWKVFDDLVQYQKNSRQRNKYYERLVQMYESAGRPDLACEARLRLSDYLLEDGHTKEVIDGLAFTIKKFPDEGRYVPRLLDRLEQVCVDIKGADQQLLRFYLEFIPLIPPKRGDAPSPYCMRMLERAIEKFTAAGQAQQAQVFAAQLAQLKAAE